MDKQKADKIITEYLEKIYGFAVQKSFSYDEAEDLSADIVKEIYLSLLKTDEIYNLDGFIWRISEHTYSKYVSRKKKHQGISLDSMQISFYEEFADDKNDEEIDRLRREVAFLTQIRRKIVYMFYYQNKSVCNIANTLALQSGTVKWHLNKARNELKEGITMERKIGKLGISPISATNIGHSGTPGTNGGPEYYLNDKFNLNIVYSVYHNSKTKEEIAQELGVTPVYIEDKIALLQDNGFLVLISKKRYTTYVKFSPETYALETNENVLKKKLEFSKVFVNEYVPKVREAIKDIKDVYIPSCNRELFEAAAIMCAINCKCKIKVDRDTSKYNIKTTDGGNYIAFVEVPATQSDSDYKQTLNLPSYWLCGDMTRDSEKYPVSSWSVDSRFSSREGGWANNLYSDYDYVYEFMSGAIEDNLANKDKFQRLRQREFLSDENKINIMIAKGTMSDFIEKLPLPDENLLRRITDCALELAMLDAKNYPPQMQDLIVSWGVGGFLHGTVALMVMDMLYENGTFKPLTDDEKITSNLLMFSDILPH